MKDFNSSKDDGKRPSASFVVGAVALLFLIVGYQAALFIHKASVARIIANHDEPDTVFVYASADTRTYGHSPGTPAAPVTGRGPNHSSGTPAGTANTRANAYPADDETVEALPRYRRSPSFPPNASGKESDAGDSTMAHRTGHGPANGQFRRNSDHSPAATAIRRYYAGRKYENFRFDPNTASIDDLMRLGFTEKQARSIDNYRRKGGRFRRKSDFAKSYVVEDSVFRRLEKYIDIPKIDINSADSATFMSLPGIGKFFAGKMVSYRKELRGYSYPEQLMDIWHFDQEKFDNLRDLIECDTLAAPAYSLWTLSEKDLASHPYIGKRAARSIIMFRENSPKADWTVTNLQKAGILAPDKAEKLARCRIANP